jgi:hypothetical protein
MIINNKLDIVLNIHRIPQTQQVELHNDDLDHDRQLRRSRHGGENNHLGGMVMKKASGDDSPL